jgi:hypothetical protein
VIPIALDGQESPTLADAALRPPAIVAPAPRQVSWGRVHGTVSGGTVRVLVKVDGVVRGAEDVQGTRFGFWLDLPRRDVSIRVVAVDAAGRRAASSVAPVYGLPRAGRPTGFRRSAEDRALARRLVALARAQPGVAAVFVQDLRTRRGAAWNARARFPAASSLKLAVAVEVLRTLRGPPPRGSNVDRLLWSMLVYSDNAAANSLLTWLGGSTSGGAAEVNGTMRALGINQSLMYGGYAVETASTRPIPLRVEEQPAFGVAKHTTAYDLARLHRFVHMAAGGRGALPRLPGTFTAGDARFLMWTLAHVVDRGKLDRFLAGVTVLHKAGWLSEARHDGGLVYWRGGSYVAVVMTWNGYGVGASADVLAGRVAAASLRRFRELRRAEARTADSSGTSA